MKLSRFPRLPYTNKHSYMFDVDTVDRVWEMATRMAAFSGKKNSNEFSLEISLAVIRVLEDFDPARASLKTFVDRTVRWEILRTVMADHKIKFMELPDLSDDIVDSRINIAQSSESRDFVERLNKEDRAIVKELMDGHTYREIEEKLGKSRSHIGTRIADIRDRYAEI